ncbi:MAG: methyltransferase [Chloroflexota bacterium]
MHNPLYEKQGWHAFTLAVLLTLTAFLSRLDGLMDGELFGLSTTFWFWLAICIPIIHQVFVVVVWRKQLHQQWMTNRFGEHAFTIYMILFNKLILGRPVSAIILAIANRESFSLGVGWRISISILLLVPVVYLGYSVAKYFGLKRALGMDHFDESYRELPLVKKGIFKYTNNAMYTFGFLIIWIPPILAASKAGILLAAFSHLYIWAHYFTTEKPDMVRIYG